MKKKIISVLTCLCILGSLVGCEEVKPDSAVDGKYATQNKETALEYKLYMNKQIQVFINQVTSRMGIAKNISGGSVADNEYDLALESVKTMQEAYDETKTVYPSTGSDDDREATLTAMATSIEHMQNYADAIKDGKSVDGFVKDFQNDFSQLTALANFYNE